MKSIFAPPPGYSPARLGTFAVLCFALSGAMLQSVLDRDAGIPDISTLAMATGRVTSVSAHKYGVAFRLHGRPETFDYPSKARGNGIVESALRVAGSREVDVLFEPKPRKPWFSSRVNYNAWQVTVDGEPVRTFEDSKEGWRSDNALSPWISGWFLLSGLYLSMSAWHARGSQAWR